jgi:hypothetical protein
LLMPSLTASTMSSLLRLTFFSTATTGLILQYAASCSQAASSSAASYAARSAPESVSSRRGTTARMPPPLP